MKARWASRLFTSSTFHKPETSLEKAGRLALEELGLEFKAKWWLNAAGWKPKEYDFFVCDLNLLIEIDGTYWRSLPQNVTNDEYKNKFAAHMHYNLLRIPEAQAAKDAIKAAIADWKRKQESI